jgi:hypothetical protein
MKKFNKSKKWLEKEYCIKRNKLEDIAEKIGVDRTTIFNWTKTFGLKRQKIVPEVANSRKYSVNEEYFNKIDTEEKAYWLGFIAADGCVQCRKSKTLLSVELAKKDEDHLIKLKNAIEYTGPLHQRKAKNGKGSSCCLQVSSMKMVPDLMRHGIVERKSKILQPPFMINKEFYRHWIRGFFDGDGSISLCKDGRIKGEFFSGSKNIIEFIVKEFFPLNIFLTLDIYTSKNCLGFHKSFSGKYRINQLHKTMYDNATVYLDRKKKIFEQNVI